MPTRKASSASKATLISEFPWRRLTKLVKQSPDRCHVAVAYFGQAGSRLLPLQKGSVLMVDMSPGAVKSGQTCPSEIEKLLRRGVRIYSCPDLHAKLFVVGKRVLAGSTNASKSSETRLIESLLETDDADVLEQARKFIQKTHRTRGNLITPECVERMKKLYRPPHSSPSPSVPRIWLVPVEETETLDGEDSIWLDRAMRATRKPRAGFEYEMLFPQGKSFSSRLREGDQIIKIRTAEDGLVWVDPPAAFIRVGPEHPFRGRIRQVIGIESPKFPGPVRATMAEKHAGYRRGELARRENPRLLRGPQRERLLAILE